MAATPATELAALPLKPEVTIEDPSSEAGKIWNEALETVAKQPGWQRSCWGRQLEDKNTLHWYLGDKFFPTSFLLFADRTLPIDWDSMQDHLNFMASEAYGPFIEKLTPVVDGPAYITHANLTPHPPAPLTAPVTEVCTCYIAASDPPSTAIELGKAWAALTQALSQHAKGYINGAMGWVIEEVEHEKLGEEKGKAFVVMYGWESKEAHMAFRDTEKFKKAIAPLRGVWKGIRMSHVSFESFK